MACSVEVAFRAVINGHIQQNEHDKALVVLQRCLECVQQGLILSTATLVVLLTSLRLGAAPYVAIMSTLEDAFEIVPMTDINPYFEFLDSNVETWTKVVYPML